MRYDTTVKESLGNGKLSGVVLKHLATDAEKEINPCGVLVFIRLKPNTDILRGVVELTEQDFIPTAPTFEMSLPGVFTAGDARVGSTKQLVSAAGESATAVLMVRHYLEREKVVARRQAEGEAEAGG